jgi:hypothetical protein
LFTIWSRCGYKELSWSEDPALFSRSKIASSLLLMIGLIS